VSGRGEQTVIAYADGIDAAVIPPGEVAALVGRGQPTVVVGWMPGSVTWVTSPDVRGTTYMAGYGLSEALAAGRLRYVPARLSAVPNLVTMLRPDVAVVPGVRRGGDLAFAATAGWGPAAASAASAVVVEVDESAHDLGGPLISGEIVAVVPRAPMSGKKTPRRPPDDVDLAIGRAVVSLFPDDPTLQFGPGAIAEAIVTGIDRPVRIWSGLVTDVTANLASRGLLTGTAVTAYTWGRSAVPVLAREGRLQLVPVEITHDLSRVSAIERFVGCNTALQVGLDGAVNVERVGGRVVAGLGGHADYCAAASRSPGGLSVIALRSTTRAGGSTIVPSVDVVSTPRCDVQVVVTEHGVADLRDLDDIERAERLTAIAAPPHREWLRAARGAMTARVDL
jgi:acyl-CoA hydrolase